MDEKKQSNRPTMQELSVIARKRASLCFGKQPKLLYDRAMFLYSNLTVAIIESTSINGIEPYQEQLEILYQECGAKNPAFLAAEDVRSLRRVLNIPETKTPSL
jgi:hypothetical protein